MPMRSRLSSSRRWCCLRHPEALANVAHASRARAKLRADRAIARARSRSTPCCSRQRDKGCAPLARCCSTRAPRSRRGIGSAPCRWRAARPVMPTSSRCFSITAPIDARNLDGSTALLRRRRTGRLAIVRLLVERGADVNLPGRSGATPLAAAAYMGSVPIVEFLIDKGADLNAIDETRRGPSSMRPGAAFPTRCRCCSTTAWT